MAEKKLSDISSKMRNLDICMLTTQSSRGALNSRPMSNNGDVEYEGDSYFFSYDSSSAVKDIEANPHVNIGFEGPKNLYISVTGKASIIRTRGRMEEHWLDELKQWFKEGLDTPGIVMVHVTGSRIKYWQNEDQGEIAL
jgi:general stress protein 26